MAATVSLYIHLHDDDQIDVDTSQGQVRVQFDNNVLFVPADQARTVAAHLIAAAEHVDPDTRALADVAATLAIATGNGKAGA